MVDFSFAGAGVVRTIRSVCIVRTNEDFETGDLLYTVAGGQLLRTPKLLDLVAVLDAAEAVDVQVGDVGTVVEMLPPDGVEVEFLDRDGHTRRVTALPTSGVLVLNRERTPVS